MVKSAKQTTRIKQGDIIKVSFNPQSGHEQAGYRPAVVVSNDVFNEKTGLVLVCPITNTDNKFPLHVPLPPELQTTGVILCEHIRALDINSRGYRSVGRLPDEILKRVIDIVFAEVEIL